MSEPVAAPCGSWRSPISAGLIASRAIRLGSPTADGEAIYWLESRPDQGGRNVVMRRGGDGAVTELTPPGLNVRTRVHEYGGGAYGVASGSVYFANDADQRLYRQDPGEPPRPLTPEGPLRYADLVVDRARGRLLAVREDHRAGGEPVNTLVAVPLSGGPHEGEVLVSGADFYAYPRLSPDGTRLAWIAWHHPDMPWDAAGLWLAELTAEGSVAAARHLAGGGDESVFQPQWGPDGGLHFVSDRSGWWNLYRWEDGQAHPLRPMEAEYGLPLWVFGMSTYAFTPDGTLVCAYALEGTWHLAARAGHGTWRELATPYTELSGLAGGPTGVVLEAGAPDRPAAIALLDPASGEAVELARSMATAPDPGYLSQPEPITFPTEGGHSAHALFYPPANRDYRVPEGERAPLLVRSHGGPTAGTSSALNLSTQFFTSRGIAVLDVTYGGSTGYGRAYRRRLEGQWGVVDVQDCVNGARWLIDRGRVDGERVAIRGSSAGGYTTLAALAFHDLFKAGASLYGIGDLALLAEHTHKFEARYLDRLVGPYPEARDLYRARSPLHHAERLACPVIFFQGTEDKVVPPEQAQAMVAALKARGLPVAYVPFEGEQHGFRRAENIRRALEAELYFYSRVLGFPLAEPLDPVPIANLD